LIKSVLRKNGSSYTGYELAKNLTSPSKSTLNQPLTSETSNNL